jgi:hypothetical protein
LFEHQIRELGELAETLLSHVRATDSEITRVDNILGEVDREFRELIGIKKSSGFFEKLIEVSPESTHTVDTLMKDHERLLAELTQMRGELPQADHCQTVRRHLHGWIKRFREFDSREITLLQNVWNVDFGGGD